MLTELVKPTTNMVVEDIPVNEIFADTDFNCRGAVAPGDVIDVMRSMELNSLQNPILVRPYSSPERPQYNYTIVSGFRRFKAAQCLTWPTIPCNIRTNLTDLQARVLNLTENVTREDLNKLQEAKSINALVLMGLTQEEIAEQVGQSRGWVQVRIYILCLPKEIQADIAKDYLTDAHIREIHKMPTIEQKFEAVKKIKDAKDRGEKVPTLKKSNRNTLIKKKRERPEMMAMMSHLQDYLGNGLYTRVLAWAAGEITDNDLFHDIKASCTERNINYAIPHQALVADDE